jgi:hypothetical protein
MSAKFAGLSGVEVPVDTPQRPVALSSSKGLRRRRRRWAGFDRLSPNGVRECMGFYPSTGSGLSPNGVRRCAVVDEPLGKLRAIRVQA